MISALESAKIGIIAFEDNSPHDVYWEGISPKIEQAIIKASKEFRREITIGIAKEWRVIVASRLMNLGYRVEYDSMTDRPLKVSWANKNLEAGRQVMMERHVCTCKTCNKEMK